MGASRFESFDDGARRAVVLAQEEARMLNHNYVGTEHILLGLIHEGQGVAAKALADCGVSLEAVRRRLEEVIGRGEQPPSGHMPFTPRATKVVELSPREAVQLGHRRTSPEHILLGLVREGEGVGAQILIALGADLSRVRQQVIVRLSGYVGQDPPAGASPVRSAFSNPPFDRFGRNLTLDFREGRLDPVVGREREIERVIQILTRRNRNVPLLIGEPGVGKDAVAAGLAEAIIAGTVPEVLRDRTVHSLDLGGLLSDPQHRGRAGELMTGALEEVRGHSALVLFLTGALNPLYVPNGTTSPLALFQSLLGQWGIFVLGACSQAEYKRREFLPGLDRLIQPVPVEEPPTEVVLAVLKRFRKRLERHHRVGITDDALEAAASLARDHVPDQLLPGAAIDLLDEASAQAQVRAVRSDGQPAQKITRADVVTALAVYSGTQSPGPSRPATAPRGVAAEHDQSIWSMS